MAHFRKGPPSRAALKIEPFPFGKTFAISLVDDTDCARLPRLLPVYAALNDSGIRATKTVWPLRALYPSGDLLIDEHVGTTATLEDDHYRRYCMKLQEDGHEIAMHTASGGDNIRERTLQAYDLFERTFGHPPHTNVMHGRNRENIYWGKDIFRNGILHRLAAAFEPQQFLGHDPTSQYYWGDICCEKTRYVRLLETRSLNTLHFDPATPFHDPQKPDVRWWFSSTYGAVPEFYRLLTAKDIQSLRSARGASIIHTYCVQFARPTHDGDFEVDPRFRAVLDLLASAPDGWYVPVVELLDRIRALRDLTIVMRGDTVTLRNGSNAPIMALAASADGIDYVLDEHDNDLTIDRTPVGQIRVGDIGPGEAVELRLPPTARDPHGLSSRQPNYPRLFAGTASRLAAQYLRGDELVPFSVGRVPRYLAWRLRR